MTNNYLWPYATHWVETETREVIKLPAGFREYYNHRLRSYTYCCSLGIPYSESHQTVADLLSISHETIKKNYQPLLTRMGLIETERLPFQGGKVSYIIKNPDQSTGRFSNPNLTPEIKAKLHEILSFNDPDILEHRINIATSTIDEFV